MNSINVSNPSLDTRPSNQDVTRYVSRALRVKSKKFGN